MKKPLSVSRRQMLALTGGAAVAAYLPSSGLQAAPARRSHGMSIFGELKYGADFQHFDYVNPLAPKGGVFSQIGPVAAFNASFYTFDTLNGYILKGNAPQGLHHIFDTLMVRAFDEPDALYGLLAESVEASDNGNLYTFHLRDGARFHDGTKVTAEDAAFSFALLKEKGHPLIAQNLKEMAAAEARDEATLDIRFTGAQTRDLPLFIAGVLPVFSKSFYTENDFSAASLKAPLGSGPYRIGDFRASRFINYQRVDEYWGRDLPVNRGKWNFDRLRYEYFRDRTAQFEAFKAGNYLFREEFTSKTWATEYNFPAVKDGRVKLVTLPDNTPSGAQGWFLNTRREKFQDRRVREALGLAFDFEWTNKNLFYGLYKRTESYFENSPMKASGEPDGAELALLEPWRDDLPPEVFGAAITPPASDGSGQDRRLLRRAASLLDESGWRIARGGLRRNEAGEVLSVEFLDDEPMFERIVAPLVKNLKLLGIDARIRQVDTAQYQDRMNNYDFDASIRRYSLGLTPGIEIRSYWHSDFANVPGGRNLSGISNPAIDALIEKIIAADNREDQVVAARALDRVLRAGHYWIPQWHKNLHHLAFWDVFAWPDVKPAYDRGVEATWWAATEEAIPSGSED
ncbi:extracellular solute-binding protein family 5 [Parvibaculum lavamentivorans DS-1]|uniref:Extracellular solute-binding protein family 5 n=1 Tax=Parvibaculum lavamentivorans (strain DS-1 / DSM 13023 / NCIMB 13966) TaxID=402881 RepID=A7HPN8_PARL1|nr:extracellular solute-binding protein [Parvibaculum lavamentivorans]ABS61871.1 extracellular solute-binding protein family 5 [Parvibaculum lavamentivorans DS-1]